MGIRELPFYGTDVNMKHENKLHSFERPCSDNVHVIAERESVLLLQLTPERQNILFEPKQ